MAVLDAVREDLDLFADFCGQLVLENGKRMVVEGFQRRMLADYFAGCTETLVIISKKNGKTSLVAALALYHLLTTADAECVIGASSRDQATILFRQAQGLVERSPGLRDHFSVKAGFREIRSRHDSGRIRVLAADASTGDGVIPTLAIVDELHRHRNADLYGVFRDGLGPRHGQIITISTAGSDEESPLGLMRARAYKLPGFVREGAYRYALSDNGEFCLHEWALDPSDDVDDLALVKQANPASWQTLDRLAARHDSPSQMVWQWKRFACGIWVRGFEQWLQRHVWDARTDDDPSREIPPKAEVVLGFDGSFNGDATGIVVVTVPARGDDGKPIEFPYIDVVDIWERQEDDPEDWTVPVLDVEDSLRAACRRWKVREIACDVSRWQRTFEILARERLPVVEFPQNPSRMIPATTRLFEAVTNAAVTHSGDERLGRHIENAVLRVGQNGGQISKIAKTSPLRIDLAVAAVMAFTRASSLRPKGGLVVDLNAIMQEMSEEEMSAPLEYEREDDEE